MLSKVRLIRSLNGSFRTPQFLFETFFKMLCFRGKRGVLMVSDTLIYTGYRETSATAHRKVDGFKMNIKVPYCLTIFAIINEILIFEINESQKAKKALQSLEPGPVYQTLAAGGALERQEGKRAVARCSPSPFSEDDNY